MLLICMSHYIDLNIMTPKSSVLSEVLLLTGACMHEWPIPCTSSSILDNSLSEKLIFRLLCQLVPSLVRVPLSLFTEYMASCHVSFSEQSGSGFILYKYKSAFRLCLSPGRLVLIFILNPPQVIQGFAGFHVCATVTPP